MLELTERDLDILDARTKALNDVAGPRVGDYVEFPGETRRISHIRDGESFQTSQGGSYYLGDGWVSFSGGLFTSAPLASLTDTGRRHDGSVWFFHNDWATAGGGVDVIVAFRVFTCDLAAPQ